MNNKKPDKKRRHYISPDALLALERLVIGRECNSFDGFTPERKTLAYKELIQLGLVVGSVTQVEGREFPNVIVQGVTQAGKRAYQNHERGEDPSAQGMRSLYIGVILLLILGLIIFLIRNHY